MAPANNDGERPSDGRPLATSHSHNPNPDRPEDNPFIAFRRYADEHISSLFQSITGLPSMVFPPSTKNWLIFDDEELNKLSRNYSLEEDLNKSKDSERLHDYPLESHFMNSDRSDNSVNENHSMQPGFRDHRYSSLAFPCGVFDAILDDHLPFGPSLFFHEFPSLRNPFFLDLTSPAFSTGWPLSYVIFSPYSPLHLERQEQASYHFKESSMVPWASYMFRPCENERREEPRWRDAFEDLLRIENGKELADRDATHRKDESGKEWLAGMIERGSLGANWQHVRNDGRRGDYFKYSYNNRSSPKSTPEAASRRYNDNEGDDLAQLGLCDAFLCDNYGDDGRVSRSPLLSIIMETRERQRKELEDLRQERAKSNRQYQMNDDSMEKFSDAEAELDHYERYFDGISSSGAPVSVATEASVPSDTASDPSTLISTVTTTERRTLADGTVRSKRIVNKRYADGREESIETNEVLNKTNSHQKSIGGDSGSDAKDISDANNNNIPAEKDSTKRSSWFWKG
ncbi:hypothetical protein LOZ61_000122 [Ophidiomyces ophidiicola]|nr:hypothetical protein LOZ61_000122 [Ophidiomyces ophidiicola]KAI1931530.1 hypothetical protein LOZ60_000061 [Ophidiomyces ophidiicola]KAI1969137.1 hypothetical protein LOZ59_000164 [Ophidiomyces ophidiicola]KAI2037254.1 hypothetical protein LOZ48_000554 [Ophidiomyces ophidiicola]KAI2150394.1 hypothetical protein LOZ27_000300 [Ophidiomyces ophidiicola]